MSKVSLIIPIYNEESHLERFLQAVDSLDLGLTKELVLVDDFSKDHSREILRSFKFKSENQICLQEKNHGKGAALRRGIQKSTGDIIVIQDADFEYDMNDLRSVIAPLLSGEADIVYGSRFRKDVKQVHRTFHYLVNRILTFLTNCMSGLYLTDMETCYKGFLAEILKNVELRSDRFGFEPEITAKIAKLAVRMQEVPIRYYPRNYMEGKKITWKDGLAALWHIVIFNLFTSAEKSFKKELPRQYRVGGRQWL